jgi:hypothetical protein
MTSSMKTVDSDRDAHKTTVKLNYAIDDLINGSDPQTDDDDDIYEDLINRSVCDAISEVVVADARTYGVNTAHAPAFSLTAGSVQSDKDKPLRTRARIAMMAPLIGKTDFGLDK